MKPLQSSLLSKLALVCLLSVLCHGANRAPGNGASPSNSTYLVANMDIGFPEVNAANFYLVQGTQLTLDLQVPTGGYGIQGGFFGTTRVNSVPSLSAPCIYVSDAGSNDIASISLPDRQFVGNASGSATDDGSSNGISMAVNNNFLYAGFTKSGTIATFALQSGCGLTFLADVPAVGLQGGAVSGMAVNNRLLVVAYGDGSIQSFDVTGGVPVANNDLQNSSGYAAGPTVGPTSNLPASVDITQDGKFAIFGDIAPATVVEVSSLVSGKLSSYSKVYTVGTGVDAGAIRLSPDQSLLYIANSEGGTVTAAFFDPATGKLTTGCTSPTLRGFNGRPWLGSVVSRDTSGTGTLLYVAEFGRDYMEINQGPASEIGILSVTSTGTSCTLTETDTSPVTLFTPGVLSIGVYPPRPF